MSPLGSSEDVGSSGHFRGWGGVRVSVGILRGRRLQLPPPPVLAAALVSGGGRSPREAEEGESLKVPHDTKVSRRGWSCRRGRRSSRERKGRGSAGGGQGGGGRAASSSLETPRVCAGGARGGGGGAALAWGSGGDKDGGNLLLAGHTHECWSRAEVEALWETLATHGEGEMGGCQVLSPSQSPFSSCLCRMLLLPNSAE